MDIRIDILDTGYIITETQTGRDVIKRHATESAAKVIEIVKKLLGIPESYEMVCGCLHQEAEAVEVDEPDHTPSPGGTPGPVPNILKQDIMIPKFGYDNSLRKSIPDYKNTWYAKLPDGRVVLGYLGSSYYTTKENVMKIPFPVPYGYFKGSGVSTVALTCLRAYRSLLSADKSLIKNEDDGFSPGFSQKADDGGSSDQTLRKSLDYVSKSTQDRIKEAAECKAKTQDAKGELKLKKNEKTRALREMVIKMGIQ